MRCDEIQALLDIHADGELPEEMGQRVERHLLRCANCAYEARALEQTRRMLRETVAPATLAPAFRERMSARLLDAFADRLRPSAIPAQTRQWTLPLAREE
jgi:anti-sigma factor RsiW